MTTETLGDPSHCHMSQAPDYWEFSPGTSDTSDPGLAAWEPAALKCAERHELLNVHVNIFDILSKSPGFGDWGLGTRLGLDNYFKAQNYRIMITDEKHKAVLWEPG